MKKLKQILALLGAILLVGMYLVTLYLGLTSSPATQNMLMASIVCTVVIPVLLYAMLLVTRVLDNREKSDFAAKPQNNPAHKTPDKQNTGHSPKKKKQ